HSVLLSSYSVCSSFTFSVNVAAPTEIYTLSLHDALPIYLRVSTVPSLHGEKVVLRLLDLDSVAIPLAGCGLAPDHLLALQGLTRDRKSTRLNSSHEWISYAVFCLKKKKNNITRST